MTPSARLKVSVQALPHATDLLNHLLGGGRTLLGSDPGARYFETISGHRLVAHRLKCGGIDVREVVEPTRERTAA
jgi:hypothetical protein